MKKSIIFIGLLAAGLFSSCSSFLEEEPQDFLGESNFYKTEKDATIGLNGVFGIFQSQAYYQRTVWLVSELPGDLLQNYGSAPLVQRAELQGYTYSDGNAEILNWWANSYQMINRANDLLEKVPAIEMNEDNKNVILGNAHFLRALAYFDLVRAFGPVPLVLETIKRPTDPIRPSRAPIADVYKQIIEELKFAEQYCLPEDKIPATEKGRVSTGAASTMLAKVYMTRASSSAAEPGDVQAALEAINKVINSNLYALLPNYADVFDCDKENGKEHVFSVQFDLSPNQGNITIQMMYNGSPTAPATSSFQASPSLVNSYAANDVRKAWNITTSTNDAAAKIFTKYRDAKRSGNDSRMNWLVTRYADVLLLQSEILNAIDASNDAKFDGINAVRARAGLDPLDATTTPTSDAFVDALVQERGWELCMEGHRRWDLLRMGKLKQVQKAVYNRDIDDKYLLFPIPQTETALNPNLLPNNDGFN